MHLLPQHDVTTVSRDVGWLLDCFGDRVDLGVSLGYRDEEYDAVGVGRNRRGRIMDGHLDHLLREHGDRWSGGPPIYVGGIAEPAIRRAGARGLSLLLPNSLSPAEVLARSDMAAGEAALAGLAPGRTGVLVDVWLCDSDEMADRARDRLVTHYREYAGAWFRLRGELGFARPDLLDKQSARTRASVVVGTAPQILAQLLELRNAGTDTFVLQVRADLPTGAYRAVMNDLALHVVPGLRTAA
jgi:alkanesulfonate monooxygenase SsuD/methylene tetrahydromethanopterin reductase-like flavin-dependent oxidoreductase (luciferase family)